MASLPSLSGREVVRVFESFGWRVARQRGSHIIMTKEGEVVTLSIPNHKEVARGTLRSLIRSANLTADEFVKVILKLTHTQTTHSTRLASTVHAPLRRRGRESLREWRGAGSASFISN